MHLLIVGETGDLLQQISKLFQEKGVLVSMLIRQEIQPQDESIQSAIKEIAVQKGDLDGFLYLAGHSEGEPIVPFLFAKHLSRYFHRSKHPSRKAFMIVVSLDGVLGMTGSRNYLPETASLTGLVKTLHQEWPWVFTRLVDLAADLKPETLPAHILSEWTDVDTRLVEVGISDQSRCTVEFKEISPVESEKIV